MKRTFLSLILLAAAAPALAGAGNFTLVNQSGAGLLDLAIRRHGTASWSALPNAVGPGASTAVVFSDEDCAFDIRARLAGDGEVVWSGLNLCEVSRVTLRRTASGTTFASYD